MKQECSRFSVVTTEPGEQKVMRLRLAAGEIWGQRSVGFCMSNMERSRWKVRMSNLGSREMGK